MGVGSGVRTKTFLLFFLILSAILVFGPLACSDQQGADSGLGAGQENVTVTGVISSSVDAPEGLAQTTGEGGDLVCVDENFICSVTIFALDPQNAGSVLISEQLIVNLISCDFRPINGSMVKLGSFAIPADLVPNGFSIECSCIVSDASIVEELFLNFSGDSQISLGPDGRAEAICSMSSLIDLANDAEAQAFAVSLGCGALTAAQFFLELFCEGADSEDPGFICEEIASVVAETFDDLQCGAPDPECEIKSCDQGCDSGTTCVQGCCQPIAAGCGDGKVTPPEFCDRGTPDCRSPDVCNSDCSACTRGPPGPCGNGRIDLPTEVCDDSAGFNDGCPDGEHCMSTCSGCTLAPCVRISPPPLTEGACLDRCDGDLDGRLDCDDSDCRTDSRCQPPDCGNLAWNAPAEECDFVPGPKGTAPIGDCDFSTQICDSLACECVTLTCDFDFNCEFDELGSSCSHDCVIDCCDGVCSGAFEITPCESVSCDPEPVDCANCDGDRVFEPPNETNDCFDCPFLHCGNGDCDSGERISTCPADCPRPDCSAFGACGELGCKGGDSCVFDPSLEDCLCKPPVGPVE